MGICCNRHCIARCGKSQILGMPEPGDLTWIISDGLRSIGQGMFHARVTRGVMRSNSSKHLLLVFSLFLCLMLPRLAARGNEEQPIQQERVRIVSLSPNVTETLYALGAGSLLVGRSDYCNYPDEATALPSVGTLYNPSLEMLLSLEPTLVISSAFVPDQFLGAVQKAGIEFWPCKPNRIFKDLYAFIEIANRVNKQAEGIDDSLHAKRCFVPLCESRAFAKTQSMSF